MHTNKPRNPQHDPDPRQPSPDKPIPSSLDKVVPYTELPKTDSESGQKCGE